jgi:DNA-binding transcriptional LysR family regulator
MSDPDLSSLRLFATICQERNLARVAQQLHVTPSAISKRLAKLEADLDSPPLLKRGRYGVVPTEAGLDLLSRSRSLLDEADALCEGLQRFSDQGGRTVRVLTTSTLMSGVLPQDVAEFLKRDGHQDISVQLDVAPSSEAVMYGLRENRAGLGVLWDRVNLSEFQVQPYRPHALVAVMPRDHPLAQRTQVLFTDLSQHDVVGHRSMLEAETVLRRSKAIPNQPLNYKAIAAWPEASLRMVGAGLGVTVLPDDVAQPYVEVFNLATVKVNERWAHQNNVLCWNKTRTLSAAERSLVDFLAAKCSAENMDPLASAG